jgi:hypothetical protein
MKSNSSKFIQVVVILGAIAAVGYFFGFKHDQANAADAPGLVSTNTGTTQGLQNTSTTGDTTGSQVITILRNLSVIKLDDAVFRNPAFALLTDISISLPPTTDQGRRNPFAPVGTDSSLTPAVPQTITTPSTPTPTQ